MGYSRRRSSNKKSKRGLYLTLYPKTWAACKAKGGYLGTLADFAIATSNWKPGQKGIGEQAQIALLKEQYPTIKVLGKRGPKMASIVDNDGSLILVKGEKSNIHGMKSLDAIDESDEMITVFFLKTIDIGSFSDNKGGGHQTNVQTEVEAFIKTVAGKSITHDNKPVEVVMKIDGRLAPDIITRGQRLIGEAIGISISSIE